METKREVLKVYSFDSDFTLRRGAVVETLELASSTKITALIYGEKGTKGSNQVAIPVAGVPSGSLLLSASLDRTLKGGVKLAACTFLRPFDVDATANDPAKRDACCDAIENLRAAKKTEVHWCQDRVLISFRGMSPASSIEGGKSSLRIRGERVWPIPPDIHTRHRALNRETILVDGAYIIRAESGRHDQALVHLGVGDVVSVIPYSAGIRMDTHYLMLWGDGKVYHTTRADRRRDVSQPPGAWLPYDPPNTPPSAVED